MGNYFDICASIFMERFQNSGETTTILEKLKSYKKPCINCKTTGKYTIKTLITKLL